LEAHQTAQLEKEDVMPRYLFSVSYTDAGAKGIASEGGSARKEQVNSMIEGLGGKMEAFYFALGDVDAYTIAELPDAVTATAISLTANATGTASVKTVRLLTPEEIDQASKQSVAYRPPAS